MMMGERGPQRLGRGHYLYSVGGILYELLLGEAGRASDPPRWWIRMARRREWLGDAATLAEALRKCDDFIPF